MRAVTYSPALPPEKGQLVSHSRMGESWWWRNDPVLAQQRCVDCGAPGAVLGPEDSAREGACVRGHDRCSSMLLKETVPRSRWGIFTVWEALPVTVLNVLSFLAAVSFLFVWLLWRDCFLKRISLRYWSGFKCRKCPSSPQCDWDESLNPLPGEGGVSLLPPPTERTERPLLPLPGPRVCPNQHSRPLRPGHRRVEFRCHWELFSDLAL